MFLRVLRDLRVKTDDVHTEITEFAEHVGELRDAWLAGRDACRILPPSGA